MLEVRHTLLASVILFGSMAIAGGWVGSREEDSLTQRAASETVLEMDGLIQPLVQGLLLGPSIPEDAHATFAAALAANPPKRDLPVVKVWSPANSVIYSNRRELIGQTAPSPDRLQQAFHGGVVAEYAQPEDQAVIPPTHGEMLLKVMAPIRENGTRRIIAVAEYYERHSALRSALDSVRLRTWGWMIAVTGVVVALLFLAVIRPNRKALVGQGRDLVKLAVQCHELKDSLRLSYRRMTAANEAFMRRLSSELHDVPAQLIGFALLRLDALQLSHHAPPRGASDDGALQLADDPIVFETIRRALADSLAEIRNISTGLAAPELNGLSLRQALELAAARHAKRTGTAVHRTLEELPVIDAAELKLCVYRFVQEGLNNAYKHADGEGQALTARFDGAVLEVTVSDEGPGFTDIGQSTGHASGIGLTGLRARVEAAGGTFEIQSQPSAGTRLTARFTLNDEDLGND